MKFFFDANVSRRIANMIAALEEGYHHVIHITQHPEFAPGNNRSGNSTEDVEYLRVLGADSERWVVISGDSDIIDTDHERAALIQSGLTFFALDDHWGRASVAEQAWKLVKMWGEIVRFAAQPGPGFYRVNMGKRPGVEVIKAGMRARSGRFRS